MNSRELEEMTAGALAMPLNPVREAGYKLRLLVERLLTLPKNDVVVRATIGLCVLADMADAKLNGSGAQWEYPTNIANAMIERLREKNANHALARNYEKLQSGDVSAYTEKKIAVLMEELLSMLLVTLPPREYRAKVLPADQFEESCLIVETLRAINEHRKLRTGVGFVSDDLFERL